MVITPAQRVSLVLFCVSCHCCILDMNFFLQHIWLKVKARIPLKAEVALKEEIR